MEHVFYYVKPSHHVYGLLLLLVYYLYNNMFGPMINLLLTYSMHVSKEPVEFSDGLHTGG